MKKLLLIIFLYSTTLFCSEAIAIPAIVGESFQDRHFIDSLKIVLKLAKFNTEKVDVQNAISEELLHRHDLKGSIQFAKHALTLSQNMGFDKGIATALTNIGRINSEQHNYFEAIKQLNMAARLFKKINDQSALSECYLLIGIAYYCLDDNPKALENFFVSLKINEETGNLLKTGITNYYIGKTYGYQAYYSNNSSYYATSFKYLDIAFQIFKRINNNDQQAICLNAKAWFYLLAGENDKAMNEVSNALILLNESKQREDKARSYIIIGTLNERKGLEFLKENNRSAAFSFFAEARQNFLNAYKIILHESQNKNTLSEILVNLASINFNLQTYSESHKYIENALKLSIEFGFKDIIRDSYKLYVKLDSIQGNYHNALIHYKFYALYQDSLSNEENTKIFAALQLQYETEKKEKQIALLTKENKLQSYELQKQNLMRNAMIISCILITLLAGTIFNRYYIKQKANIAIENTLHQLKTTQKQLVENERLASLGKYTADVAGQIAVHFTKIRELNNQNRTAMVMIKTINKTASSGVASELKDNLLQIYNYGKDADAVVKKTLKETRKNQV